MLCGRGEKAGGWMKVIHDRKYYISITCSSSTLELVEDENGKRYFREIIPASSACNDDKYIYYPIIVSTDGTAQ